jgi:hypothetical protein
MELRRILWICLEVCWKIGQDAFRNSLRRAHWVCSILTRGGERMAQHIAQKLRLTSALLGTVSRKDLAAAFRRVNPETAFDLGRADKWLQGRARPRELSVYEDWSKVLDLGQTGAWIAECDLTAFIDNICARHAIDRKELERRATSQPVGSSFSQGDRGLGAAFAGSYACYSNALSPYYRGQLIRGTLSIEAGAGSQEATATYSEMLPTGRLQLEGSLTLAKRGLCAHLREAGGDAQFFFCLFPPSPPGSVLSGYMCGATIIGPEPQPSITRILIIRLLDPTALPREWGGYLPPSGSIVEDLVRLGLKLDQSLDWQLLQFLAGNGSDGASQIPAAESRALLEVFDRHWLGRISA